MFPLQGSWDGGEPDLPWIAIYVEVWYGNGQKGQLAFFGGYSQPFQKTLLCLK